MSTEMTQVPGAAAAQTPTNPLPAAQPAAEQPKADTPANPAAPANPAPKAPVEPAPAVETPWLEEETLGLSHRTWCEIIGGITVAAAAAYFAGQYMASKDDASAV